MIDRNYQCPKCGNKLLARYGIFIYCTLGECDWAVQKKRKEDLGIPEITKMKKDWE